MSPLAIIRLLLMAALLSAWPGHAQAQSGDQAGVDRAFETLRGDTKLMSLYAACPADLAPRRARPEPDVTEEQCAANPAACLSACRVRRSGEHCFALARVFQEQRGEKDAAVYESLFAAACQAGHAGGCTNRASGIRNGGYQDDPWRRRGMAQRQSCQYRAFNRACQWGDAWGCTMLGQALDQGEGVRRNLQKAGAAYDRSCEIAPNFAACQSGKSWRRR